MSILGKLFGYGQSPRKTLSKKKRNKRKIRRKMAQESRRRNRT